MRSDDLIASARNMIDAARTLPGRPKQADLGRAVSTAYYAIFHELCRNVADSFVGGTGADRSDGAWRQTYRALQHRDAQKRCRRLSGNSVGFPDDILVAAREFASLQDDRHDADYDPGYRVTVVDAEAIVFRSESAIQRLRNAPMKDRRAFCVWIVFGQR